MQNKNNLIFYTKINFGNKYHYKITQKTIQNRNTFNSNNKALSDNCQIIDSITNSKILN